MPRRDGVDICSKGSDGGETGDRLMAEMKYLDVHGERVAYLDEGGGAILLVQHRR